MKKNLSESSTFLLFMAIALNNSSIALLALAFQMLWSKLLMVSHHFLGQVDHNKRAVFYIMGQYGLEKEAVHAKRTAFCGGQ